MGALIFVASGIIALDIIALILAVFSRIMPDRLKINFKPILLSIGGIFILFQILYFANIIPPIPLSLKENGVYHSISRTYNNEKFIYQVIYEPAPRYLFFKEDSDTFHWISGTPIYFYSAIFSPADLNVKILHRWSYFNTKSGKWVEVAKPSIPILGGRAEGYRGYSYITNPQPGKWRVDVMNERGQVLGRRNFTVVQTNQLPELKTALR